MRTKSFLILSAVFIISCQSADESVNRHPNIVFLFADDQRSGTIHALGNEEIITPTLDSLAQHGLVFNNAYIMGGTSGAVCMPSRAMLLTGRNFLELAGEGQFIPEDHELIGETFTNSGYNCFGTGKWHNGKSSFNRCFNQGDEVFFGGMNDHWNVPLFHYDSTGQYKPQLPEIEDYFYSKEVKMRNADHMYPGKHSTEIFSDAAIQFIQEYQSPKPFFVYVSYMTPHDPRSLPQKYLDMYDTANISLPPNFLPEHPFDNGQLKIRDEQLAPFPRTPGEVKIHIRDYYAMITYNDVQAGRIITALRNNGYIDNTLLIYSGDNGLAVGQHGLLGKQNVYEHSIKVPLIMSGFSMPVGETTNAMCYLFDIYPTLCEMLNIPVPESVNGKSFLPCIRDDQTKHRELMYFGYRHLQRAIRKDDFKLIEYNVKGKRKTQLFDLKNDPFETQNLAFDKEYGKKLKEMKQLLSQQASAINDTIAPWACE